MGVFRSPNQANWTDRPVIFDCSQREASIYVHMGVDASQGSLSSYHKTKPVEELGSSLGKPFPATARSNAIIFAARYPGKVKEAEPPPALKRDEPTCILATTPGHAFEHLPRTKARRRRT